MQINPITNINFKSKNSEEKLVIKTSADLKKWLASKEPMIFEEDSIEKIRWMNNNRPLLRQKNRPIKSVKRDIIQNERIDKKILEKFNSFFVNMQGIKHIFKEQLNIDAWMEKGLSKYLARVSHFGLTLKNCKNKNENILFCKNKLSDEIKFIDNNGNLLRSYTVSDGAIIRNLKQQAIKSMDELQEIKASLDIDCDKIKKSFEKTYEFLLKKKIITKVINKH